MLLQLIMHRPRAIATIVTSTPTWVWGLLASLIALGLSQARQRSASLARIALTPVAMTALSLWGAVSAFGASPPVLLAWSATAAAGVAAVAPFAAPAGTHYEPSLRIFQLPGSWMPLLLILGVFLTKYVVGVELAMQPALARDGAYTLAVACVYGVFSGVFVGRTARLWRLAARAGAPARSQPIHA